MDAANIVQLFLKRETCHQFFNTATPGERMQARADVRRFVAAERGKRDKEIAAAEAELHSARKAIAEARAVVARADAVERDLISRINRARQAFDLTAGVVEHRLDEYDPTHRNGAEAV